MKPACSTELSCAALAPAVGERLQLLHLARDGLVGGLLQPGIDRGAHDEPVGIDVVVVLVRPLDQPFAQVLDDVRRGAGRLGLPLEIELAADAWSALRAALA